MRAAGILSNVAPNGAGFLAGWIGREIKTGMLDSAREIEIDDARLYDRALIFKVEVEDAVHTGEGDDDPTTRSERPAGQTGSCATPNNRHLVLHRKRNNAGDFISAARKGDDIRMALLDRAIVFVKEHVFGQIQYPGGTQKFLEFAKEDLSHRRCSLGECYVHYRENNAARATGL